MIVINNVTTTDSYLTKKNLHKYLKFWTASLEDIEGSEPWNSMDGSESSSEYNKQQGKCEICQSDHARRNLFSKKKGSGWKIKVLLFLNILFWYQVDFHTVKSKGYIVDNK